MKKTRITDEPRIKKIKEDYPFIHLLIYQLGEHYDRPPYNGRPYYAKFYISLYHYYTNKHKQKDKIKKLPKDIESWNNYETIVYGSDLDDLFDKINNVFIIRCIKPISQWNKK